MRFKFIAAGLVFVAVSFLVIISMNNKNISSGAKYTLPRAGCDFSSRYLCIHRRDSLLYVSPTEGGRVWVLKKIDGDFGELSIFEQNTCDTSSIFRKKYISSTTKNDLYGAKNVEVNFQLTNEDSCLIKISFKYKNIEEKDRMLDLIPGSIFFLDDKKNLVMIDLKSNS